MNQRISPEDLQKLAADIEKVERLSEKLKRSLKPLGYYNIPEILDKRRLEFGIPNGAFESYPGFDKCYIWQVALEGERETFSEGGRILMPDATRAYKKNTAPRGILVSAGLQAMDSLYSTGFEIGHIVRFKKFSPFIMPVAEIDGHEFSVMVVRDGDIEASEDMAISLNAKRGKFENVSPDGKSYDWRYVLDGKSTGNKVSPYYDPSI